ncbi:MAG: hypothetical protein JNM96_02250 [Bacteroidia bacterium]|nr:hypothetical protein [Bacteroidia bacterium]
MKFNLKYLVTLILCGFLFESCKQVKQTVSLTYIQPYCGGARPTEEMEKDAATPKPYATKKITLVSESGKIFNLETDEKGNLNLKLKDGIYKMYEPWRFNKGTPDGTEFKRFDNNCLNQEWNKEFSVLEVKGNTAKLKEVYTIYNYCDFNLPCILESQKPPMRE